MEQAATSEPLKQLSPEHAFSHYIPVDRLNKPDAKLLIGRVNEQFHRRVTDIRTQAAQVLKSARTIEYHQGFESTNQIIIRGTINGKPATINMGYIPSNLDKIIALNEAKGLVTHNPIVVEEGQPPVDIIDIAEGVLEEPISDDPLTMLNDQTSIVIDHGDGIEEELVYHSAGYTNTETPEPEPPAPLRYSHNVTLSFTNHSGDRTYTTSMWKMLDNAESDFDHSRSEPINLSCKSRLSDATFEDDEINFMHNVRITRQRTSDSGSTLYNAEIQRRAEGFAKGWRISQGAFADKLTYYRQALKDHVVPLGRDIPDFMSLLHQINSSLPQVDQSDHELGLLEPQSREFPPRKRTRDALRPIGEYLAGRMPQNEYEGGRYLLGNAVEAILQAPENRDIIRRLRLETGEINYPLLQAVENEIMEIMTVFPNPDSRSIDAQNKMVEAAENMIHLLVAGSELYDMVESKNLGQIVSAAKEYSNALDLMHQYIIAGSERERFRFLTRNRNWSFQSMFNIAMLCVGRGLGLTNVDGIQLPSLLTERQQRRYGWQTTGEGYESFVTGYPEGVGVLRGDFESRIPFSPSWQPTEIEKTFKRQEYQLPIDSKDFDAYVFGEEHRGVVIFSEVNIANLNNANMASIVGEKVINGWSLTVTEDGRNIDSPEERIMQFSREWDSDPSHQDNTPGKASYELPVSTEDVFRTIFERHQGTITLSELRQEVLSMDDHEIAAAIGEILQDQYQVRVEKMDEEIEAGKPNYRFTFSSTWPEN